jgi:hypothetical protein
VPKAMQTYLEKHLKRCLSKEDRKALFKEHAKPEAPKVDKYMCVIF